MPGWCQGQGDEGVKIRPSRWKDAQVAVISFDPPVQSVSFTATLSPGEGELDTLIQYAGRIFADSQRIVRIWLWHDYAVWEDDGGKNHVTLYTQTINHLMGEPLDGEWLIIAKADRISKTVVFNSRPEWLAKAEKHWPSKEKLLDSSGVDLAGELNLEVESGNSLYAENGENEQVARAFGHTQVEALGVPVTMKYGVTTEHTSYNNLNYFTVEVDRDRLIENLRKRAIDQSMMQMDSLDAKALAEERARREYSKAQNRLESEKQNLEDSIASIETSMKSSVSNSVDTFSGSVQDSFERSAGPVSDSVKAYQAKLRERQALLQRHYSRADAALDSVKGLGTRFTKSG